MKQDEFSLMISGIQHFCFCQRQWALIHVEQQWLENLYTVKGNILHEKAHTQNYEKRGSVLIMRGLPVISKPLGVHGVCDVVEFHEDLNGITLKGKYGQNNVPYTPVPIEYKLGQSKTIDADRLQVCAQAMCLEEMLVCNIPKGYIFYGKTRQREEVLFDKDIRNKVDSMVKQMKDYFLRSHTPKVKTHKGCSSCSIKDICLPRLNKTIPVKDYITKYLGEEEL